MSWIEIVTRHIKHRQRKSTNSTINKNDIVTEAER